MSRKRPRQEGDIEKTDGRKRRRIDDASRYDKSLYWGKISDVDKTRLLRLQLGCLPKRPNNNSLVKLATSHDIRRGKTDVLLPQLREHMCIWGCSVPIDAIRLLERESERDNSLSPVYDVGLQPCEKDAITKALATCRFEVMTECRRRLFFQEHDLTPANESDPVEAFDKHWCSSGCRIRANDNYWFMQIADIVEIVSRTQRERERKRRFRKRKMEADETADKDDLLFWEKNWPRTLTESVLKEILQESCDMAKSAQLRYEPCSFCDVYEHAERLQWIPKRLMDISKLEENVQAILEEYPQCKARSHRDTDGSDHIICETCRKHVRIDDKTKMYRFRSVPTLSWANACWIGDSPSELEGLTFAEELVIAKAHTTKCWAKINVVGSRSHPSTRQRAASGNVCVHPHEITNITAILPRPINSLFDEMAVIFVTGHQEATASMFERTPLLARRGRILKALRWLKEHNPLYFDVVIDYEMLRQYPESGIVEFPAHIEKEGNIPSGASTTYSGHGIDKVEGMLGDQVLFAGATIPMNRTGSVDVNRAELSLETRKLEALRHIKAGGGFLTTSRSAATLSSYETPQLYGYLWPTLFPYGVGYFDDPIREQDGFRKITTAYHVKHLLRISDRRFQLHTSFIFVMHNLLIRRRSSYQAKVAVRRGWWKRAMKIMNKVNASTFTRMRDAMLAKRALKDFSSYEPKDDDEKSVLQLLKFVSFIDNHIEGSIGEVRAMREELRAITRNSGTPTLFVTINPADAHHPLVSFFAGQDIDVDRLFNNPDSNYTCLRRAQTLANNPVAGAMFSKFMIDRFIDVFLGCSRKSKIGVFGRVKHYYFCAEAQNRGSIHIHGLIWLEGAESPKRIQERCTNDPNFKQELFDWLESIIKLSMPENTAPLPTGTYEETKRSLLGLPPQPEDEDFERQWPVFLREVLESVGQRHTHGDVCFKKTRKSASSMTVTEQDENCRFHLPAELVPFTYIDEDGKIHLRRGESMLSGYNPIVTGGNQCNTDIKFVGSGRLGMAMATYMSNYTAKSTLDSAIVMSAICAALASLEAKHNGADFTKEEDQCQLLLLKTLNQMTARRELSGQQVASSLLGIPNHFTDARFVRIYWSSVLSWLCADEYPLRKADLEDDEDEDDAVEEQTVTNDEVQNADKWVVINTVAEDETKMPPIRSPIFDVLYRPKELDSASWWDIMSHYKKIKICDDEGMSSDSDEASSEIMTGEAETGTTESDSGPQESNKHPLNPLLRFLDGHPECHTHALRRRENPHVPVLIGYAIPKRANNGCSVTDKYAVAMLALFQPWRRDKTNPLKDENEEWVDAYIRWMEIADSGTRVLMDHFEEIWECREAADDYSALRRGQQADEGAMGEARCGRETAFDNPEFQFGQYHLQGDESEWNVESVEDEFSMIYSDRMRKEIFRILNLAKFWSIYALPVDGTHSSCKMDGSFSVVEEGNRESSVIASDILAEEKIKRKSLKKKLIESAKADEGRRSAGEGGTSHAEQPRCTTLQEEMVRYEERMKKMTEHRRKHWSTLHEWQKLAIVACNKYSLNREQKQAFLMIVDHRIRRLTNVDLAPLRLIIGGPGGSGKSHIYDTLHDFYKAIKIPHELAFTAPTGVAADGINGSTVHSFLYLNSDYDKLCEANSKARNELSERLALTKLLIIDEVYFVSCREFEKISKNMKLGRGFSDDCFGNMDIVLSGDQFQLSCPLGKPLFTKDYAEQWPGLQGQSDVVKEEMRGFAAFRSFTDCVILKDIMRQSNKRYVSFINRLRWGTCTVSGPDNDFDYLRQFTLKAHRKSQKPIGGDILSWINEPSKAAPLITYTNAVRDVHNWEMTRCFSVATKQEFKLYYSEDYVSGQTRGSRVFLTGQNAQAAWNTPPKKNADDLAGRLPLAIGMPVILVENLAVDLGLCKSTRGTLVSVEYFVRHGKRYAVSANVDFPSYKGEGESHVVAVPSIRKNFSYEINDNVFHGYREQLPLIPGFAFTIHNSQSQSLHSLIAHLDSAPGTAAAYVIMSRIKCTEDEPIQIRIIGDLKKLKISTHAASHVRKEEERLSILAAETANRQREFLSWYEIATGEAVF